MKEFHTIQLEILQQLLYSEGLKYSKLKPSDMEGSQFTFHLDQLIKNKLVKKVEEKYTLTDSGKELANRMDLGDSKIEAQAKVSVIMACQRDSKDGREYLLYTRLKSPFYGFQGFPTGKVKRGEDIQSAAKRELFEETGLTGTPELFAIRHYKIYDNSNELLEDKVFFAFRFNNPDGDLISAKEGNFEWVKKEDVWNFLKNPVNEIKELFEVIDSNSLSFQEKEYKTDGF